MPVQSIIFDKMKYNGEKAMKWLMKHGFKYDKVHETMNYLRFRQTSPSKKKKYFTIKVKKFIKFIVYS